MKPIKLVKGLDEDTRLVVVSGGYVLENLNNFNLYVVKTIVSTRDEFGTTKEYILKQLADFTIRQLFEELFADPAVTFVEIEEV